MLIIILPEPTVTSSDLLSNHTVQKAANPSILKSRKQQMFDLKWLKRLIRLCFRSPIVWDLLFLSLFWVDFSNFLTDCWLIAVDSDHLCAGGGETDSWLRSGGSPGHFPLSQSGCDDALLWRLKEPGTVLRWFWLSLWICPWLTEDLVPSDCQTETLLHVILVRKLFVHEPLRPEAPSAWHVISLGLTGTYLFIGLLSR